MERIELIVTIIAIVLFVFIDVFIKKGKSKGKLVGRIVSMIDGLDDDRLGHYIMDPIVYEIIASEFSTGKITMLSITEYNKFISNVFLTSEAKEKEPLLTKAVEALWTYSKYNTKFISKYASGFLMLLDSFTDIKY